MALPVLSLVVRALSQQFPDMPEGVPNYIKKELAPVLTEVRKAFNSLKGPSYNFGTWIYGDGPPSGAPSSDRAVYIDRLGGPGAILYDWNGAAWELISSGGGGGPSPATTVVAETAFGQTSAVGTGLKYAREDHTHGTPAAPAGGTPASTVTDGTLFSVLKVVGVSTNFAREDHKHGTPPIFQSTHDFGTGSPTPDSVTQTVADAGVQSNSQFVGSVRPTSGRDLDEMELGPVEWAVGNIVANTSFDVIVASIDGTATGSYTVDIVRHSAP